MAQKDKSKCKDCKGTGKGPTKKDHRGIEYRPVCQKCEGATIHK